MPDKSVKMMSSRPYLIRAFNEWILDNSCTPYILVDASLQGVRVPTEHVANGQIVLNISPSAVKDLIVGNNALEFSARFGGVPMQVYVPLVGILAVYARENGDGMVFGSEPGSPDPDDPGSGEHSGDQNERPSGKPSLKVVK